MSATRSFADLFGLSFTMHDLPSQLRGFLDEAYPLPPDMLALLRRIAAYDAALLNNLDVRYLPAWRAGKELAEGHAVLQALAAYVVAQQRKPTVAQV